MRRARLADVCEFKPSKNIPRGRLADTDLVSFVPMNDLGEIEKNFRAQEIKPFGEVVRSYTYFADGDVLCAKITPCFENGKLGIANDLMNGTGFGSSEFVVMRPGAEILAEYLYYFLARNEFREAGAKIMTGAVGHKRVPKEYFEELLVPLPELEEQKRIVAILDQAFAALDCARALAEANLADAGALFVQVAQDNLKTIAVKGEMARVGDIADHCLGKMLDKSKNKGTFRPYLRNINVRWFEVDTSDVLEMRIEDRELDRYQVHKGDLLICEGGYPGRASIYQSDEPTYFQKALHRVRFDDESQAKVLMYWLFVEDKLGRLKDHFSGTGISHFTGKALAAYPMPVADPATTARAIHNIDKCLEKTTDLVSSYQAKLTDLANLRQSLLQTAFSGQL